MNIYAERRDGGFSLVEVIIASAVIGLFFTGLFVGIQFSVKLIGTTKAKSGALAIANEHIEYARSLLYADIGTVAGIPSGNIPQNATTSLNGTGYSIRTLIQFVDAPDDGLGGLDDNGILADYKEVKVEVSWDIGYGTSSIFLVTDIVPPGIETTDGGGTLTVNVFDADVQPLSGASVRLYNDTTTSTIDVTRNTNASGIAMFSGAPAAANYQITVTDTEYSTDGTYSATTSNPNPTTPHVAVIEGAVSTMNFQIDQVSDLTVRTVGPATYGDFTDTFTDALLVNTQTDVAVGSGEVVLGGGAGSYLATGNFTATSTTPGALEEWNVAWWSGTTTLLATARIHIYAVSSGGTYTLIPDTDLPGNAVGFTSTLIDISSLDVSTYDSIALGATLATLDANETPSVSEWGITYTTNQPTIANIDFDIRGTKTIGTDAALAPIYKYSGTGDTGSTGSTTLTNLEWDVYEITLTTPGYDIADACSSLPYVLDPGVSDTLVLTLVGSVTNSLRVHVTDVSGNPLPDATVELSRSGFSDTEDASLCGQAFFNSGLVVQSDYELFVQAPGYADQTVTAVNVDGDSRATVVMNP